MTNVKIWDSLKPIPVVDKYDSKFWVKQSMMNLDFAFLFDDCQNIWKNWFSKV